MAYSPHVKANGTVGPAGANKPPVGFLSFVKKLSRWLNRSKKQVASLEAKRDISRLEHERRRERDELLSQRRYYENLLRHTNEPLPQVEPEIKINKSLKSVPELKITQPAIETNNNLTAASEMPTVMPLKTTAEIKPESVPVENLIKKETLSVESIKDLPSSQDILPMIDKIVETPKAIIKPAEIPAKPVVEENDLDKPVEKPKVETSVAPVVAKKITTNGFLRKLSRLFAGGTLAEKLARERQEEEAIKNKIEVEDRFWQPYNGVKANLIKDQVVLFFNWRQKILTLFLSLVLCCLAISLIYVGLLIWQKEKLNNNRSTLANFDAINAEVTKNEDELKEITTFNKKLNIVSYLLNNHVHWINFFGLLENNTLKSVYYTKFTGDLSGKYKIPAIAKNLDSISLQLEVMKADNMVRGIQYSSAQKDTTPGSEVVNFNLEMTLDPKIFVK